MKNIISKIKNIFNGIKCNKCGELLIIIGFLMLFVGYFIGVVGINSGLEPEYELVLSNNVYNFYKIEYHTTYPWLGILFGIYGLTLIVTGLLQIHKDKAKEIIYMVKCRINVIREN
ncbi:MAG: hypothetical protein P1P80_07885 [ANME-2 cluster archaeon]|nr:hypothetical protein [ANME-2 cluster archaeon]